VRGAIDKIRVEGFKSVGSMDLTLRELNILIGPNGVGKSNFVSLFRLFNQLIEKRLQVHVAASGGAEALLHFGRKATEKISIDAVRMVAPFFDDFILEPLELNEEKIRLEWREKGQDATFGPGALSDGTLRFICLAALL
jgi:predicted ATPase